MRPKLSPFWCTVSVAAELRLDRRRARCRAARFHRVDAGPPLRHLPRPGSPRRRSKLRGPPGAISRLRYAPRTTLPMIGATSGWFSLNPNAPRIALETFQIETDRSRVRQVSLCPGSITSRRAGCFSTASCSNRQRTCCQLATGSSFILRILSPRVRPLASATVPASGVPTTASLLHADYEKRQ